MSKERKLDDAELNRVKGGAGINAPGNRRGGGSQGDDDSGSGNPTGDDMEFQPD
jgi:hypothetical protein